MEDSEIKRIIKEICRSMQSKNYDPVNQIGGYIISNDLGYIPDFDDNRNKIARIDRSFLIEAMIKEYIK